MKYGFPGKCVGDKKHFQKTVPQPKTTLTPKP